MTDAAPAPTAPDAPQDAPGAPEDVDPGTDQGTPDPEPTDVPEDLGDKGKQALDRMKAERNAARKELRDLKARLEELERPKPKDGEPDVDAIRRDAEKAAAAKANERLLRAEVKAAAAGKLSDPQDALRFLDLGAFEVDDDGSVDTEEIAGAIEDLLKNKPYLSAQGGRRFQGSADGGAKKNSGPGQLTREQVQDLYRAGKADEVVKAKREGRLNDLLGIKK